MKTNITVSVIIPSFNSSKTIFKTISEVQKQTAWDAVSELIVVDSSDDEDYIRKLKEYKAEKYSMVTSGVRIIPAIQRNIGAKHATGDILCFIDSDAYPERNWLKTIIDNYKKGIKVGGGSYKVPPFQLMNKLVLGQYYLEFSQFIPYGKSRKTPLTPSCNLFCDRQLFSLVGGFPESRASEDSMFGLKVNEYEQMFFIPDIVVYHIFRENREHFLNNQLLLGKYVFVYRKACYKSSYYSSPLYYIFFPMFIIIKSVRIMYRAVRLGKKDAIRFVSSLGYFVEGMSRWFRGFHTGFKNYDELIETLGK